MDELVKELRKIYIEKLTKSYPLERILVFFAYFLGRGFLHMKAGGGLVVFLYSFQLDGIKKILTSATIGDVFIAIVLTFLTTKAYFFIKKIFFIRLSKRKGFEDRVKLWQNKTQEVVSAKAEYNQILASDIRKRIDSKKKIIIGSHLLGEMLFSVSVVLLLGFSSFDRNDFICFLTCWLFILWIQRSTYLFYLKEILPEIVSEVIFLRGDFNHQKVFEDEFSGDGISA